jgi:hypothetical protein
MPATLNLMCSTLNRSCNKGTIARRMSMRVRRSFAAFSFRLMNVATRSHYQTSSDYHFGSKMRTHVDASELPRSPYLRDEKRCCGLQYNCLVSPRLEEYRMSEKNVQERERRIEVEQIIRTRKKEYVADGAQPNVKEDALSGTIDQVQDHQKGHRGFL